MKTAVTQTSLLAYLSIEPDLGERQQQVLGAIRHLGTASNLDIAEHLNLPINVVTPRCGELRAKHLVQENHKDISRQTGRLVTLWRLV